MMEWISVKDQLPECNKKSGLSKVVFVCDARGRTGFGIYCTELINPYWFTGGDVGEDSVRIDFWMPIPEPPIARVEPDEISVVRCKDCIHYGEVGDCEVHPYDGRVGTDYFCADGEEKT